MSKDNKPMQLDMSNERITDLAMSVIRVNQHAAGIIRDMHREPEARDFMQANVLFTAYVIHMRLSSACDCEHCDAEQTKLSGVVCDRVIDLLAAFAEHQEKGGK